MKIVMFLFVFVLTFSFASATCTNYLDDGNDADAFGSVEVDGVFSQDICRSNTELTEYYCDGNSLKSASYSCASCSDGICYGDTCTSINECNPVLRKWCDGSSWLDSGYCTDSNLDCYLVDSTCGISSCTEGACDYKNHKYCSSNTWVDDDYCDLSRCGDDIHSFGYCFCEDSDALSETDCSDDVDNDCDGDIDEACTCVPGDTRDCGANLGVCKAGLQVCQEDASWSLCFGASYAASQIEECNGIDDDCDGKIDEGCGCVSNSTQVCGSDVGSCQKGLQSCVNGTWNDCVGDVEAFPEICGDLFDNDCDEQIDSEDDTCAHSNVTLLVEVEEEREIAVGDECTLDADCDSGTCMRGICVEEESIDTSSSSGLNTGEESESRFFSNGLSSEEKKSSVLWYVIPLFLFLLGGFFWYMQKKKKNISSVPEKKVASMPRTSLFSSRSPPVKQRKGIIDKELDTSFQESSRLFKK